jgi:CelD/BcsL family acetyltransferase involved in cellulose biosynthesis
VLTVRITSTLDGARGLAKQWDELAVAEAAPFCSPAWMLAYWEYAAPPSAELRIVTVHDDAKLVAIAPFAAYRGPLSAVRYRMLGALASTQTRPLAAPGWRDVAGRAVARALAAGRPRPDTIEFEATDMTSGWPDAVRTGWPGTLRPLRVVSEVMPAPELTIAPGSSYEQWLQGQSRNFRQQARRRRRQLEASGARFRMTAGIDQLDADLDAFWRLHHARWEQRGGSVVLTPTTQRMLRGAATELLAEGRFRLWMIETDDGPISAHLFINSGTDTAYYLGGFDEQWGSLQPAMQTLLAAIEHAWTRGDTRVDLGGGDQAYKYRLSNGVRTLGSTVLIPVGPRTPLALAQLAPEIGRQWALARIPNAVKDRVKRSLGLATSGHDRVDVTTKVRRERDG